MKAILHVLFVSLLASPEILCVTANPSLTQEAKGTGPDIESEENETAAVVAVNEQPMSEGDARLKEQLKRELKEELLQSLRGSNNEEVQRELTADVAASGTILAQELLALKALLQATENKLQMTETRLQAVENRQHDEQDEPQATREDKSIDTHERLEAAERKVAQFLDRSADAQIVNGTLDRLASADIMRFFTNFSPTLLLFFGVAFALTSYKDSDDNQPGKQPGVNLEQPLTRREGEQLREELQELRETCLGRQLKRIPDNVGHLDAVVAQEFSALKSQLDATDNELQATKTKLQETENRLRAADGAAGGSWQQESGASPTRLCLTLEPQIDGKTVPEYHAGLYGGEYWDIPGHHVQDVPCVVCQAQESTTMMVPGTNICPLEWVTQYTGHLAGTHYEDPA
ncbi:hypothetical protein BaRGS_00011727, partial [Batillaria attramentaria]